MSKRVRGVMRVMMIGLVAMLAAKAEAHYVYANGKYYWHSVGCDVTIGDIPPTNPDALIVGCVVTTARVEVRCPDLSIVDLPIQVSLTPAQQSLPPGVSHVEVIVDDAILLFNPSVVSACGGAATGVLIRKMAALVTIQCIGPSASCGQLPLVTTSIATAAGTLPAQCTLNNCPNNKRQYTTTSVIHGY